MNDRFKALICLIGICVIGATIVFNKSSSNTNSNVANKFSNQSLKVDGGQTFNTNTDIGDLKYMEQYLFKSPTVEVLKDFYINYNVARELSKQYRPYMPSGYDMSFTDSADKEIISTVSDATNHLREVERLYRLEKYKDYYYGKYDDNSRSIGISKGSVLTSGKLYYIDYIIKEISEELKNDSYGFMDGYDVFALFPLLLQEGGFKAGNDSAHLNFNSLPPDLPYYHGIYRGSQSDEYKGSIDKNDSLINYGYDLPGGINVWYNQGTVAMTWYFMYDIYNKIGDPLTVDKLWKWLDMQYVGTQGNVVKSAYSNPDDHNRKFIKPILMAKWKVDEAGFKDILNRTIIMPISGVDLNSAKNVPGGYIAPNWIPNPSSDICNTLYNELIARWGCSADGVPVSNFKTSLQTVEDQTKPWVTNKGNKIDWNEKYGKIDFAFDLYSLKCCYVFANHPPELEVILGTKVALDKMLEYLQTMNRALSMIGKTFKQLSPNQQALICYYPVFAHAGGCKLFSNDASIAEKLSMIQDNWSQAKTWNEIIKGGYSKYSAHPEEMFNCAGQYEGEPTGNEYIHNNLCFCYDNMMTYNASTNSTSQNTN